MAGHAPVTEVNVVSANVSAATKRLMLNGLLVLIFYYFKCLRGYCTVAPDQSRTIPAERWFFAAGGTRFREQGMAGYNPHYQIIGQMFQKDYRWLCAAVGRTLGCPRGSDVVFEYMSMRKDRGRFEFLPIAEYTVDLDAGTVAERVIDPSVSTRAASPVSPVHAGSKPGSYAPATNT